MKKLMFLFIISAALQGCKTKALVVNKGANEAIPIAVTNTVVPVNVNNPLQINGVVDVRVTNHDAPVSGQKMVPFLKNFVIPGPFEIKGPAFITGSNAATTLVIQKVKNPQNPTLEISERITISPSTYNMIAIPEGHTANIDAGGNRITIWGYRLE